MKLCPLCSRSLDRSPYRYPVSWVVTATTTKPSALGARLQSPLHVALTGSNGKTTVKEMLAAILAVDDPAAVVTTQGNLNNHIGVPLTHLAQPDVALITNAGPAHLEGFGSLDGVAQAKGEISSLLRFQGGYPRNIVRVQQHRRGLRIRSRQACSSSHQLAHICRQSTPSHLLSSHGVISLLPTTGRYTDKKNDYNGN